MPPIFNDFSRRIQEPQVAALVLALLLGSLVILFFGSALAPYFTSLVVAYLLEGMIRGLERIRLPRMLAVLIVFSLFILVLNLILFGLLPSLAVELARVSDEIPRITGTLKELLHRMTESASGLVNPAFAENLLVGLVETSQKMATGAVGFLFQGLPGLISLLVYLVLVPFLVFFFMKDKVLLQQAFKRFLPRERDLINRVLQEVEAGVGGYIQGKFWEMLLLGVASYAAFVFIGFDYAFLVGVLTGLSVLIPFLGLAVVTVPVALLGVFQWGLSWESLNPLIVYAVLQTLDGSAVAPLILGETVKVHPTTIMLAILFFGSLWGVVGVFFAVPLAVLVRSVLDALLPHQPAKDASTPA